MVISILDRFNINISIKILFYYIIKIQGFFLKNFLKISIFYR